MDDLKSELQSLLRDLDEGEELLAKGVLTPEQEKDLQELYKKIGYGGESND